jgi:hemoglobin
MRDALRTPALNFEPTAFARIGGASVVDVLLDPFYAEMDTRPEASRVRELPAANLKPTKFVLKRYCGEWLGGPPLYSCDRGHSRLGMLYMRLAIGKAERDAWLACMGAALAATVTDEDARMCIGRQTALADHMRNRPPDDLE